MAAPVLRRLVALAVALTLAIPRRKPTRSAARGHASQIANAYAVAFGPADRRRVAGLGRHSRPRRHVHLGVLGGAETGESMSHSWGATALVDVQESLLGFTVTGPAAWTLLIAPPRGTALTHA